MTTLLERLQKNAADAAADPRPTLDQFGFGAPDSDLGKEQEAVFSDYLGEGQGPLSIEQLDAAGSYNPITNPHLRGKMWMPAGVGAGIGAGAGALLGYLLAKKRKGRGALYGALAGAGVGGLGGAGYGAYRSSGGIDIARKAKAYREAEAAWRARNPST